jgi:hypothetical protein
MLRVKETKQRLMGNVECEDWEQGNTTGQSLISAL